ncbi:acyltransferase [Pseudonocardia sp. NPDC049635]|uniref:acyltransferase family protein n=1 Tax=Pseudonocardia sp. NPDC049635 TaxID=3155506 RepID=UPI0033FE6AC1
MSIRTSQRRSVDIPAQGASGTGDTRVDRDQRASCEVRTEVRALTGLRIVAALWVVAFHFHFTPLAGVAMVNDWLGPLVTQGALGVDLFFVLSGFVIAWTYLEQLGPRLRMRDAGGFVWARAARMWPAYAVVLHLFGVWLVARAVFGGTDEIAYQAVQPELGFGDWLEQLLLVQMWTEPYLDGASWVGPTWSISAEWLAYLLFPLLAVVFFRLRNLPFAVLATGSLLCVAPLAAAFLVVGSPYYPYSWLVRILGGFSAGVLAMLAVRKLRDRPDARTAASASTVATFTFAALPFVLLAGGVVGHGLHGLTVLLFPVLVGALALADRGPVHRLLSRGPVVHGGRISYALYLVHIPMFEVYWFLSDSGAVPAGGVAGHLIALTVFVGTLPVAHLLYTLVERPARRWMRALPRRRSAAAEHGAAAPAPVEPLVGARPRCTGPRVDTDAARRDPETAVFAAVTAATGHRVTTDDARTDPETALIPVVGPVASVQSPVTVPETRSVPRPADVEPSRGAAPADPAPLLLSAAPLGEARPASDDGRVPLPSGGVVPAGTARWVLDRLAATRAVTAGGAAVGDGAVGGAAVGDAVARGPVAGGAAAGGIAADLVALARTREDGARGQGLFSPLVDGPGPVTGTDRVERLRSLQRAARGPKDAPRGGVVPAPRAIRSASALPGTRSGAENCGRGSHRRDVAHGSAATPIVAASGEAARRRRKRPAHGA